MLDVAVAYDRYRFLGNEFLTWLWFAIENDFEVLRKCDAEFEELHIGNRMVLENRLSNGRQSITIKADDASLQEAILALSRGALITDLHLIYKSASHQWQFLLKGEGLNFSVLKLPETGKLESSSDMDGIILEKIGLYQMVSEFIDNLYSYFIKLRLSEAWNTRTLPQINQWIQNLLAQGKIG